MKRGLLAFVIVVLVACKGSGGAKKRVPDGEKASAAFLINTVEAVASVDGGVLLLAEGVSEVCGKGCQCLAVAASAEAGNKAGALYGCPSLCSEDARTRALAAAPGQQLAALAAACTPEGIGLTAASVTQVGDDWLAAFVSGQYFADAYDAANADDRKAYEQVFASFTVPLAPTAGMVGATVASAKNVGAMSRSRTFVAIDAKGGLGKGTLHAVRLTPTGAVYVPAATTALADARALADGKVAADDDTSGGTGTAMALEEGRMGKKDSDRAEGQYKMKQHADDPQLARQQAIEQARAAGVLGSAALQEGGAFATLTGTGDLSAGFDDRDIYGGLLGDEVPHGVLGLASTPIRDQLVVIADRDAPAAKLLEVMLAAPDGTVLATEHAGRLAALPLVFTGNGLAFAPPPMTDGQVANIVVDVAGDTIHVRNTLLNEVTEVKAGDAAALETALGNQFKEAAFADRRDLQITVTDGTKVAQLVGALDGALSAGARSVQLGAADRGATGWGTIGTGRYGTIGRDASLPTVGMGQPSAVGDLDKAIIRRYVKRNIPKITYCFEKQLLVKPDLAGTVTAQFFISPSGAVASSNATGVDPEVASCVADVIRGIEFPKPRGGGGVQVNYPFNFRPTGG